MHKHFQHYANCVSYFSSFLFPYYTSSFPISRSPFFLALHLITAPKVRPNHNSVLSLLAFTISIPFFLSLFFVILTLPLKLALFLSQTLNQTYLGHSFCKILLPQCDTRSTCFFSLTYTFSFSLPLAFYSYCIESLLFIVNSSLFRLLHRTFPHLISL